MAAAHADSQVDAPAIGQVKVDAQEETQASSQISIKKMFWWVTLSAFAAGSFSKFPEIIGLGLVGLPAGPSIVLIIASWIVFLIWHWQQRNHGAIVIHVVTVALMLLFMAMFFSNVDAFYLILLSTMLCSQVLSIVLGLTANISKAIQHHGKSASFLVYCVVGATLILATLCGIGPSLQKGFPDFHSITMGAMIGFWMGLYQATAKSKWIQEKRFLGAKPRHIVLAGFLFSFFSPMFFGFANQTIFRGAYYYLPAWISPALGFVAAAIVIIANHLVDDDDLE